MPTPIRFLLSLILLFTFSLTPALAVPSLTGAAPRATWWSIQSIDTMKQSRDLAREKATDSAYDPTIDQQVSLIAGSGATHIALGTPYDEEFVPYLKRWVAAARRYGLLVWFRGNWSGWEKWFDYPPISRADHLTKTSNFIHSHPELFVDGDLFSACPECENGGPGDPRQTGDVVGHRQFLQALYTTSTQAFKAIHTQVQSNLFSMNGDVAKLIMDPPTTASLGGVVVVDHYVRSPDTFLSDIQSLAASSQGQIIIGEFGAPIPDLHGSLDAAAQADWISQVLTGLTHQPKVIGVNYWTGFGASTRLWDSVTSPRPVATVVHDFYTPTQVVITTHDALGLPVGTASVSILGRQFTADSHGVIRVALPTSDINQFTVSAPGYASQGILVSSDTPIYELTLERSPEPFIFKVRKLLYRLFRGIL